MCVPVDHPAHSLPPATLLSRAGLATASTPKNAEKIPRKGVAAGPPGAFTCPRSQLCASRALRGAPRRPCLPAGSRELEILGRLEAADRKRVFGGRAGVIEQGMKSELLARYRRRVVEFDRAAERRQRLDAALVASDPVAPAADFSPRELAVLELVALGLTNREIGERLLRSEETIKDHVKELLAGLSARNRAHAVALAARRGLLDLRAQPETARFGSTAGAAVRLLHAEPVSANLAELH